MKKLSLYRSLVKSDVRIAMKISVGIAMRMADNLQVCLPKSENANYLHIQTSRTSICRFEFLITF